MSSVAAYLMYDVSLIIMCLWCYEKNWWLRLSWCDDVSLVIVSLMWWCAVGDCFSGVMMCRWWLCLWCDEVWVVINCVSGVIMWRWWLCLWCDVSLMIVSGMRCRWLCVWCDEVLLVIISLMVWWCVVNDCVSDMMMCCWWLFLSWRDDVPLVIVSLMWWCVVGNFVSGVMMCRW